MKSNESSVAATDDWYDDIPNMGSEEEDNYNGDGNIAFDQSLRMQNPSWGIRDLDDILPVSTDGDLELYDMITMPANNFMLVFHRSEGGGR